MVRYLKETASKRSAATDRDLTRVLRRYFAGMSLNTLKPAVIHEYVQHRRSQGRKDGTIRRELSLLSTAINHARHNWEWQIPNPVAGRKPGAGEGRIRWITKAESCRLIEAAKGSLRSPHLADFIELGLYTGMRSQEMLGLSWDRVDLHNRIVYLPAATNKSKRNLSVPLNRTAYRVLVRRAAFRAEHCPDNRWVFAKKDGSRITTVKKGFRGACARAGIPDFTPHDLRHTCAAWLVQARVPIAEIRDLLRHTSVQVTEKYAHLAPDNVRSAVQILDASHDRVTLSGEPTDTDAEGVI